MKIIDLRSDTVTKPDTAMWQAMLRSLAIPKIKPLRPVSSPMLRPFPSIAYARSEVGIVVTRVVLCKRARGSDQDRVASRWAAPARGRWAHVRRAPRLRWR